LFFAKSKQKTLPLSDDHCNIMVLDATVWHKRLERQAHSEIKQQAEHLPFFVEITP